MEMDFKEAQDFFKSWGVYPSDESTDDYNQEVIEQGINRGCYFKLIEEAKQLHGDEFAQFCARQIDATDDAFYLSASTWDELLEAWEASSEPA